MLVRAETQPDDIHGMEVAKGILTSRGGMTSHAAVVARGMGIPCVAGAGAIEVNEHRREMSVDVKGKKVGLNSDTSVTPGALCSRSIVVTPVESSPV